MSNQSPATHLQQIIDSARRLGVELNESEALQWLAAMAARDETSQEGQDIVLDTRSGVFGHRVTLLDFSDQDLAHFRQIGRLVEIEDEPGVETALALSGSAAQSKIQTYPGDCDFFERVNIHAGSREAACQTLARLIRDKALHTERGPNFQLMEVRFGGYPEEVIRDGRTFQAGASIGWNPAELRASEIEATQPDGAPIKIRWNEVALNPGWCKLDWIIADATRGMLANASNMLDATWEAPDCAITPLDGYLDPYFQEVYLEVESVPVFAKLAQHVSADALDNYVTQLEKEIEKYLIREVNYGKAAKRMYNVFRYTGRYPEAVFIRELFDEPATILYQIWSLIRALDESLQPGSSISLNTVHEQADQLIMSVVKALEGDEQAEIVRLLLRLENALTNREGDHESWEAEVNATRATLINLVNNFFYEKMAALPPIKAYMEEFRKPR